MKRIGKIVGFSLLGIVLIVAIAGFIITRVFNPNDYKNEIQQFAHDQANIALSLKGEIGWSLFPWLGLEVNDADVASVASPDQPLAHLKTLGLAVRVAPLLRKEIQMSGIRIDGLDLMLVRDADGRGNWEGIGPPTTSQVPAPSSSEKQSSSLKINIGSVAVSNTRISYHDDRNDSSFTIQDVALKSGAVAQGSAIPLMLSGRFSDGKEDALVVDARIDGQLVFDSAAQRYRLDDLKMKGSAAGKPFGGKALPFSAEAQLGADLAARTAQAQALKLHVGALNADGEIKIRDFDTAPQFEGVLSVPPFDLRALLGDVSIVLPAMTDSSALKNAALQTRIDGTAQTARFRDLKLTLDKTTLTGSLEVDDFSTPALRLTLKGDALDIDRYLPPEKKAGGEKGSAEETADGKNSGSDAAPSPTWSAEPVLPLPALQKLAMTADVAFDTLTLSRLPIRNAALKIDARNGLVTLNTLQGNLLDGRFAFKGRLDARPSTPQLTLQGNVAGIAADKLVESRSRQRSPLQGRLNLDTHLTTAGNSPKAWIDRLNGNAGFSLTDGVLRGINIEGQLCRAIALANRKTLTSVHGGQDTPFQELKGNLKIGNGVADNPDLRIRVPGATVNGRGAIDLRALTVDYRIGIVLEGDQRAMPDPACQINKNYAGIEWPLRCQGPLENISRACTVDSEGIAKIAVQLAGKKLTDKLDDKLNDKAPEKLRDALKGLLKR